MYLYFQDKFFYGSQNNAKVQKPWILVGKRLNFQFSQMNEPLYILDNVTLWEQFEFKSFKKINQLATLNEHGLKWSYNMAKNFFERRGDFENFTLIGVTHPKMGYNILPKDLSKIAKNSSIVPNTYEVSNLISTYTYFQHIFSLKRLVYFVILSYIFSRSRI